MRVLLVNLFVALLCVSTPVGGSAQTGGGTHKTKHKTKVEAEYDGKRDETLATVGPFEMWKPPQNPLTGEINYESIDLSVSFTYPGKRIVKPKFVTLMLYTSSEGGARFEKNRRLTFSTNAGQYDFGDAEYIERGEGRVAKKALGTANTPLVR